MTCDVCGRTHKNDRWNRIRAHDLGWFEQKNGTVYCPAHVPAWVADWRARRSTREAKR